MSTPQRVAGDQMTMELGDFEKACLLVLEENEDRIDPDVAVRQVACEGVRLAREHIVLKAKYAVMLEKLQDLESTFDLRWKADERARQMWQTETGNDWWPNTTNLTVWLLQKLTDAGLIPEASESSEKELPDGS